MPINQREPGKTGTRAQAEAVRLGEGQGQFRTSSSFLSEQPQDKHLGMECRHQIPKTAELSSGRSGKKQSTRS